MHQKPIVKGEVGSVKCKIIEQSTRATTSEE